MEDALVGVTGECLCKVSALGLNSSVSEKMIPRHMEPFMEDGVSSRSRQLVLVTCVECFQTLTSVPLS